MTKIMSTEPGIRREVGSIALLFTALGSIIGSGWLFGAWRAAQLAGPGAVYAWLLGAVIILFVALTFAELGAMFPESGGSVRYGLYSHGSLVGFVAGWASWISIVSVIPVEAEASVQYMSSWSWGWAQDLYHHAAHGGGELTTPGLAIAAALVIVYFLLNFWSVKVFASTNSAITFFKLIVPAATAIALMSQGFHWENFHIGSHGGPYVVDFAAILTAVATSGIVFSYNGFQSPVNLAGEARNPGRSVPFAIFGSIALSTVIYLLLQVAFLGAVSPEHLQEGWAGLEFSSPFAQLALALNLNWLAILLYADAFASPSGTGSTYTATTARMIYAMERNGDLPKIFGRVHPRYGIPRPAMWLNLAVSFVFLFCFRGWGKLAAVISVATIVTYLVVPVSVMVLRRTAPDLHRPLRIPGLAVLAPMASYGTDHSPVDHSLADLLLLPGTRRLGGFRPQSAGRLVDDRLLRRRSRPLLGRQQRVRGAWLSGLRLGSSLRRARGPRVLCLGPAQRLVDARRQRGTRAGGHAGRCALSVKCGCARPRPGFILRVFSPRSC
jgi:amino acid transporter